MAPRENGFDSPDREKGGKKVFYQILKAMKFWYTTDMVNSRWEWIKVEQIWEIKNWCLRDWSNIFYLKNSQNGISYPLFIGVQSNQEPILRLFYQKCLAYAGVEGDGRGRLDVKEYILSTTGNQGEQSNLQNIPN